MPGNEVAGHQLRWPRVALDTGQNRTAAAAAAAHKSDVLGIAGLENQVGLLGLGKDLHYCSLIDVAAQAIANIIIRPFAEHEASLLRRIAASAHYVLLAAADAGGYRELLMGLDQFLSPFIR